MGVIGMVRGFLKELGVTLVLIATLFALDRLIPIINGFINERRLGLFGAGAGCRDAKHDNLLFMVFGAMMIGATYIAYQGETLTYEGNNPKGIVGSLLGFLIGAVNGYLLFGTIWWLMDFYQYPFGLVAHAACQKARRTLIAVRPAAAGVVGRRGGGARFVGLAALYLDLAGHLESDSMNETTDSTAAQRALAHRRYRRGGHERDCHRAARTRLSRQRLGSSRVGRDPLFARARRRSGDRPTGRECRSSRHGGDFFGDSRRQS